MAVLGRGGTELLLECVSAAAGAARERRRAATRARRNSSGLLPARWKPAADGACLTAALADDAAAAVQHLDDLQRRRLADVADPALVAPAED
jgi:hypothetical protein